jgi:hypothetical protein
MGLKTFVGLEAHWLLVLYGLAVVTAASSGSSLESPVLWLAQGTAYLVAYLFPAIWLCSHSSPACQRKHTCHRGLGCKDNESNTVLSCGYSTGSNLLTTATFKVLVPHEHEEPAPKLHPDQHKPRVQPPAGSSFAGSTSPSSNEDSPAPLSSTFAGSPLPGFQHHSSSLTSSCNTNSSSRARLDLHRTTAGRPAGGHHTDEGCITSSTSSCTTPQTLSHCHSHSQSDSSRSTFHWPKHPGRPAKALRWISAGIRHAAAAGASSVVRAQQ